MTANLWTFVPNVDSPKNLPKLSSPVLGAVANARTGSCVGQYYKRYL